MSFPCEVGCPRTAVVRLGKLGLWSVCADCAELPRFRRFRVAHVIVADVTLRRDSAGWWVAGELVPPAPLAEVLARLARPRPWTCEHGRTFKEGCARCGPLMVLT